MSIKGRGSQSRQDSRFLELQHEAVDDGWTRDDEQKSIQTRVLVDTSRTIITYNKSPDVPFDRSINPYKGCEHGCSYCFARPTHAYLDLSPGLDFETKIFTKPNAAALLEKELSKRGYKPDVIALGVNTDAYQPVERKLKITRALLEVLNAYQHPVAIITKSSLIERDLDLLREMASKNLVSVNISVTSLDHHLSRKLEPRATAPQRRVQTIRALRDAGIPVGILFAPLIPAINDSEMETILETCAQAGATTAGYVLLRLPREVSDLFEQWLWQHYPLKANHVLTVIRELREGKLNQAQFGQRMSGSGPYAQLMSQRFRLACKKLGLNRNHTHLDTNRFQVPIKAGDQLSLF